MINIAIDGPSGAGKSTLAKGIAARLNLIYVDTGALYRTVGLYIKRADKNPKSPAEVVPELCKINVELKYSDGEQQVWLGGENVSGLIREPEISMYASAVSAIPAVRDFLLFLQRDMAKKHNVIMDGRDIGTVILPDADVKIFLSAPLAARAKRRFLELTEKGVKTTYEDVLADMEKRDRDDETREVAPAVAAPDAILLDNSGITLEETIEKVAAIIKEKTGGIPD